MISQLFLGDFGISWQETMAQRPSFFDGMKAMLRQNDRARSYTQSEAQKPRQL